MTKHHSVDEGVENCHCSYTQHPSSSLSATGPSHLINQSQLNNLGQLSDTQTSATERGRQYVDLILAN